MRWCPVPDLADELRRVADSAARAAQPLPVAEVMRLGDRRLRRRRSRDVLAAAVVAGVAVVAVLTGAVRGAATRPPGGRSAAAMPGGCTEHLTLTAPDGRMSVCVSYAYRPGGTIHVRGVEASFASASGQALPYFTFTFRNPATDAADYRFSTPIVYANAVRSHSTGPIMLGARNGMDNVHPGDVLDITLNALQASGQSGPYRYAVATLSLSLSRHGLRCPFMGQSWFDHTPTC